MYEESNAIGSLRAAVSERTRLAAASHRFNAQNQLWVELFADSAAGSGATAATAAAIAAGGGGDGTAAQVQESVCRFCFSADGELISPCMCKGQVWTQQPLLPIIRRACAQNLQPSTRDKGAGDGRKRRKKRTEQEG